MESGSTVGWKAVKLFKTAEIKSKLEESRAKSLRKIKEKEKV